MKFVDYLIWNLPSSDYRKAKIDEFGNQFRLVLAIIPVWLSSSFELQICPIQVEIEEFAQ